MTPFDRWLTYDGDDALRFYRLPQGFLLRFVDTADFMVDIATGQVTCTPDPDIAEETLVDLHFNQVLPLILGHGGDLVLHASAVSIEGKAVAFLGATGRGKSTLAASFARAGHPFLTDDGLILDADGTGYRVRPRRPILRLRPDSAAMILGHAAPHEDEEDRPKGRVAARPEIPFHEEEVPLAAIYLLAEPHDCLRTTIASLPPSSALSALMGHGFLLDVEDRARVHAQFDRLADVAVRVPCYSLDYPRAYKDLPSVLDSVIAHLHNGGTIA